ncbi:hypothetical protein OSTOST_03032, partial [Ostertagia ostertagi]
MLASKFTTYFTHSRFRLQFAVGGFVGGESRASVEYLAFKEENPKWQIAPSILSKQRGGAGVAVLNGLLYAAGGRCWKTYLSCIE